MRLKDHLNKLEYFCAVAEVGSLKKASERVFVGQPQLSKVIQQLEEVLDTALFVRSPKGVVLTPQGDELYSYSKGILAKINEAEFSIKSNRKAIKGEIRIGTYDSIARYFFPEFIKYMDSTAPDLSILLQTGRSPEIFKLLKKGELDIAIIVDQGKPGRGLGVKDVYEDTFGLYQCPSLANSFRDRLIYFPYGLNDTEKSMKKFGYERSVVCDNLETVKSLTEQALGIGLLPHKVARESLIQRRLMPVHHPKIRGNSFDQHKINMYFSNGESNPIEGFVIDEIDRFLQIWSKN